MNVAVFHPGTQHSWQTALALQQLNRLAWYATSIFYQPDRFPYRLERMLPAPLARRAKAEFRRVSHPGLDPALVRTTGLAEWIERAASRAGWREAARRIDMWGNRRFVDGIAKDIRSPEPFALWGYNGSSATSFALAREYGRTCILDRTNGDFRVYNAMMAEVADRFGAWFLPVEREVPQSTVAEDDREYALADTILVGSPFAEQTIRQAVPDQSIHDKLRVLEYCYDEALFAAAPPPRPVDRKGPVKFLFLGLVIPRKGIHHVLEALARIPASQAELTIVGEMRVPAAAFAPFAGRVNFRPTVARADVPAIMREHHVLVLPSYFEGARIVLYEALASGCALIQSDRCTPAVSEKTGILLDCLDTDAVHAAMLAAIEDRDRLDFWRSNAMREAEAFNFAHYREKIARLLADLGLDG
ncbi:MAG: glycosyltransferase family 4 protein [Novosphingobium sp.]